VAAAYAYDGEGRRVKQVSGGQTRYDCYDPLGNPVWEYTTRWKTYHLYFNGRLVFTNTASTSPSTVWLHADHPGTVRVKSKASGRAIAGTRLHYHPFGEQTGANTDPVQYEFTGKERDDDTKLDYFGARYFSAAQGRFTTPDPFKPVDELAGPGPDDYFSNPQYWNEYAYSLNDPLKCEDSDGYLPHVVGALVGGGVGGALELYGQIRSGQDIDWAQVATKTGVGAAVGGTGRATFGAGPLVQARYLVFVNTAARIAD
jgi:RHS repeat-associated protein